MSHEITASEREILLGAAISAPSMHNTQPWRFRFDRDRIHVYVDLARALPIEDPDRRMLLMSAGTALFNLRVAAAHLGYLSVVHRLPDETHPTLVATVVLSRHAHPVDAGELYWELGRRRTNRFPYSDVRIPEQVRAKLCDAAVQENAQLEWVSNPLRREWLKELLLHARLEDAFSPPKRDERRQWVGGDRQLDGVPASALGPRPGSSHAPVRDLSASTADLMRPVAMYEHDPQLVVLSTSADRPVDRLRAGEALERVLLVATAHRVSASLLNQPVERADFRWQVRAPYGPWTEPQAVLRLGYGPEIPPTPRRSVEEFLIDAQVPGSGVE